MCSCDALECVTFHPFSVLCFQLFLLRWFWFREILEVLFGFQNDGRRGIQYFNIYIFHEYWLYRITYSELIFELKWTKLICLSCLRPIRNNFSGQILVLTSSLWWCQFLSIKTKIQLHDHDKRCIFKGSWSFELQI